MGIQEVKYKAVEGSVLVRVDPPPANPSGIESDPFTEKRPDRGTIIDSSDSLDMMEGDFIGFDHRGATRVEGDVWSVAIDSVLGIITAA